MQSRTQRVSVVAVLGLLACFVSPREAQSASHLWRIHELFSNGDGSVQYLVLHECCGATQELFIKNLEVESKTTGQVYVFPRNLTGSSARKYLLLATQAFADLPGVPAPDFILPAGFFPTTAADKIWYSEARNYDSFTLAAGALPLDGFHALRVTNYATDATIVVENEPTNYAGAKGRIDVSAHDFVRGDCNAEGVVDLSDAIHLLQALFKAQGALSCSDSCDANDDGEVDVSDAVKVILALFESDSGLPLPAVCGPDPTPDAQGCLSYVGCPPEPAGQ